MDWTLLFLIVLLVGSIVTAAIVLPALRKIAPDGSVRVLGIKFL